MRSITVAPGFNGVGAGQTATLDLPATGTYHALLLQYVTDTASGANEANMKTELTGIRLKVNGKTQREFSFTQLTEIMQFYGQAFATGMVPIWFSQPYRRTVQGEDALAWGMNDVDTFQVEVDIADNSAQTCSLSALMVKDDAQRNMGPIVKWKRYTFAPTASGVFNLSTLPKTDAYYAIHCFHADILDALVKRDGKEEWDMTLAQAAQIQAWGRPARTQQSGLLSITFDDTNRAADALPMVYPDGRRVQDFRVDFNMNDADTVTIVTETLGLRD